MLTTIAPDEGFHLFAWRDSGTGYCSHAYMASDPDGISACNRRVAGDGPTTSDLPRCADCLLVVLRAVDHNAKVIEALVRDFDERFPPEPRDVMGDELRRLDGDYGIEWAR